jgi:hypothetical protein
MLAHEHQPSRSRAGKPLFALLDGVRYSERARVAAGSALDQYCGYCRVVERAALKWRWGMVASTSRVQQREQDKEFS